jgi:hypothetical protein
MGKPSFVPATPPYSFLIRLFLKPKAHTHPNMTLMTVVRILKAVFISFAGPGAVLEGRSVRFHPTCLPKLSWIRGYVIPIFAVV